MLLYARSPLTCCPCHISVSPVPKESHPCVHDYHLHPVYSISVKSISREPLLYVGSPLTVYPFHISVLYLDSHAPLPLRPSLTNYRFHNTVSSVFRWSYYCVQGHLLQSIHSISPSVLYSEDHTLVCRITTYILSIPHLRQSCIQIAILLSARSPLTVYPFHISVSPIFKEVILLCARSPLTAYPFHNSVSPVFR
jgi:hypothetical protein